VRLEIVTKVTVGKLA